MIFLYLRIYALKELLLLYNLNVQSLPSRERGLKQKGGQGLYAGNTSLPSRERGLKLKIEYSMEYFKKVAPLAGAWIETLISALNLAGALRRSPRGSVD